MTVLLLDTHAFVWAVSEPDRLSGRARETIADRSNHVLVSAASFWEMSIKHHAGRWPEAEPLLAQHRAVVERLGAEHLAITSDDAVRAGGLRWQHTDPFDRVLAAQALNTGAVFVTRDAFFVDLVGLDLLW